MTNPKNATQSTYELIGQSQAKFAIASLDEPGQALTVYAQFNPKELTISRPVPWGDAGEAGGGNSGSNKAGIEKQFTGAKGRSLTVELLFDDTEKFRKGNIVDNIGKLEKLASVREPKSKTEEMRRPHWCIATWGSVLKEKTDAAAFRCVIEQIDTKYEMFDAQGNPLRARCTLKLTEATSVSTKKADAAAPAGGAPAGGAPAGGAPAGGSGTGSAPAGGGAH